MEQGCQMCHSGTSREKNKGRKITIKKKINPLTTMIRCIKKGAIMMPIMTKTTPRTTGLIMKKEIIILLSKAQMIIMKKNIKDRTTRSLRSLTIEITMVMGLLKKVEGAAEAGRNMILIGVAIMTKRIIIKGTKTEIFMIRTTGAPSLKTHAEEIIITGAKKITINSLQIKTPRPEMILINP